MGYVAIFIVIGFFWIIGQIIDSISESANRRKMLEQRRNERLRKFGDRVIDKDSSLIERNLDIINEYLATIKKSEYSNRYYIANKVRDCINDIMLAEEEDSGYPGNNYLSTWRNSVEGEYGELSDYLLVLFKQRQTELAKEEEEENKRVKRTQEAKSKISALKEKVEDFGVFEQQVFEKIEKDKKELRILITKEYFPIRKNIFPKNGLGKIGTMELISAILLRTGKDLSFEDIYENFSLNTNTIENFKFKENEINSALESIDARFLSKKEKDDFMNVQHSMESRLLRLKEYIIKESADIEKSMEEAKRNRNKYIAHIKDKFDKGDKDIVELFSRVIISSLGIDPFFQEVVLEYREEEKILVINYRFVDLDNFPNLKEEKIYKNGTKKDIPLPLKIFEEAYDKYLTSVSIRVMYELFMRIDLIALISFNGWVHTINKGTGNEEDLFIMSIQTKKEDCLSLNLAHIDPKIAFRGLKGISAAKLSSLTPINPILKIDTEDHRFVEGYNVAEGLNSRTNLAAIDWQDFENLIRELFGKEFGTNGGEVKITQASRDGGVDAIAFDPDPIRGGKIVIQAKRYTNTVDVSAVRDLHGTVQHEGANKGILVTTATFGADSYEFIKNKPLTLIDGGGLLYLLEKHGYSAKIDLREAKKILNLKQK